MSNSSINIQTTDFKGNNLGSGTTIYDSVNPFNTLNFKSLVGSGGVALISGTSEIIISGTSIGEVNTASNVGSGTGIYSTKVLNDLRFKSLLGAGNINISNLGTEIQISGTSVAQAAGDITQIQYNGTTGNTLGANSGFTFSASTQSLTVGTRGTGSEGCRSFSHGYGNLASGINSHAEGNSVQAIGFYSHAEGKNTCAIGNQSHAGGCITVASGINSFTHGQNNIALACNSAILGGNGNNIAVGNTNAVVIGGSGIDLTGTSYIDTIGVSSLAIINSPANNVTSDEILVRNTSTGVIDYFSKASIGATDIYVSGGTLDGSAQLILNRSEGQPNVNINLSALSGGTGGIGSANNGLTKTGDNITLGGTLTGNTIIDTDGNGISIGNLSFAENDGFAIGSNTSASGGTGAFASGCLSCAIGDFSHTEGKQTKAIGNYSHAEGGYSYATELYSHAEGCNTCAIGLASHSEGGYTCAIGEFSHSEGNNTCSSGAYSHAEGWNTISSGYGSHSGGHGDYSSKCIISSGLGSFNHSQNNPSQTVGHGALANRSAILGGLNHNIEAGNTGATIIGGNTIKLTGASYIDTTAVDKLAIFTPPNDTTSANLLTWNPTTRKVGYIAKTDGSIISDINLKTCIDPIKNINLNNICGVSFMYNELTPQEGSCAYGVIAHEIQKEFPLAVKDRGVEHNGKFYKTVDYNQLTPILLNKIKELEKRIIELENYE